MLRDCNGGVNDEDIEVLPLRGGSAEGAQIHRMMCVSWLLKRLSVTLILSPVLDLILFCVTV